MPTIVDSARANRAFLSRAVRFLATEAGIGQFLDIGTGIPTSPNVHEIAQGIAPGSRVVYVDADLRDLGKILRGRSGRRSASAGA
jgi:hypothetical protein